MSRLSVQAASKAAIGIAALRYYAATTEEKRPPLQKMAKEMLADTPTGRVMREVVDRLAQQEKAYFPARITYSTISEKINRRRQREMDTTNAIYGAALLTLKLDQAIRNDERDGVLELMAAYKGAIKAIDDSPGGKHFKTYLGELLQQEVELAVSQELLPKVRKMLSEAKNQYLSESIDEIWMRYGAAGLDATP